MEQRHKRITSAWDQDLAQEPELPKDWTRWIDKVAVRENFIFYRYKRGGAPNGYCTFCGKEVPISGHPYHNKKGRCACCRHPIVFKALGRAGYIRTEKDYAYLIQRCKDGFVLREFWAERTYWKDSLPSGEPYWHEFRRSIYDRSGDLVWKTTVVGHGEEVVAMYYGYNEEEAHVMSSIRAMKDALAKVNMNIANDFQMIKKGLQ